MTRSHSTTTWADTQPLVSTRPATTRRSRASRRTVLTLACFAAGVGGAGFKLMQSPIKPVRVHSAADARTVSAVPLVIVATAAAAAAQVLPEPVQQSAAVAEAQQAAVQPQAADVSVAHDALRSQLRWVRLKTGQGDAVTLDAESRLLLARTAARKAGLADVGLDYRDVYGVIHAESSWVARDGMGKNGVTSQGLAQFEPATARAVGLRNPNDPVEAVQAAALHLKEAAQWSARRLERLNLGAADWATRLREGVSVYYNLSTRGRNAWHGLNSDQMPVETRLHIRNVREGVLKAAGLSTAGPDGGLQVAVAAPIATVVHAAAVTVAMRAEPVRAQRASYAPAGRVQATFTATPRHDESKWVRTKDSISLPEGSIRWTARETAATGG